MVTRGLLWTTMLLLVACGDGTRPPVAEPPATVSFHTLAPGTIRTLIVEVSGPGIDPTVVQNFPVGADTIAQGTPTVPAGSSRRIVVSAVDSGGTTSYRADTTVRLVPGSNPAVSLLLQPLAGSVGITARFGAFSVSIAGPTALASGDSGTFAGTIRDVQGAAVAPDSLSWATSDPSVLQLTGARARALRPGTAVVSAAYRGAVARRTVFVSAQPSTLLLTYRLTSESLERVLSIAVTGLSEVPVAALGVGYHHFDLSPDRNRLVFARPFDNRLFQTNADGSGLVVVIATG